MAYFWAIFFANMGGGGGQNYFQNGRGRSGGQTAGGHPKPFLGPGSLSLRCRHWESSKGLARLAFCEMLSQYPQSSSQGFSRDRRGWAAACDPDPLRPFARTRVNITQKNSCGNKFQFPCPIWLDDQGAGQWKGMEEVPGRASLVPPTSPCFLLYWRRMKTDWLLDYQGRAGISSIDRRAYKTYTKELFRNYCVIIPALSARRTQISEGSYF